MAADIKNYLKEKEKRHQTHGEKEQQGSGASNHDSETTSTHQCDHNHDSVS